jgi:flagellar basal-body rod modification protein FlgD
MPVEAIGRPASDTASLQQNNVGINDFLQIFLTQLNFQDPLEPVDNREFIAQLAQFSTLEIQTRANSNIEGLLDVESADQSLGLLGKTVEIQGESGISVGDVTAVRFDVSNGSPQLTVKIGDDEFLNNVSPARVSLVR